MQSPRHRARLEKAPASALGSIDCSGSHPSEQQQYTAPTRLPGNGSVSACVCVCVVVWMTQLMLLLPLLLLLLKDAVSVARSHTAV